MTPRERHTSDEEPAAMGRPTPPSALRDASLWEDWFQRASPDQQRAALHEAASTGILWSHQLPAPPRETAVPRPALSALLNGLPDLPPLRPPGLEIHDGELDRAQREAVAGAMATDDVFLIQGFPGTGKSRTIAEIILQAAERGERILFVAPCAAALDRVLERLAARSSVCPIRCLAAEEAPKSLPPAIVRTTLAERLRTFREQTLPAARAARDAARSVHERYLRQQSAWVRLRELAEREAQLADRLHTLEDRRGNLAAEVEQWIGEASHQSSRDREGADVRALHDQMEALESQLAGFAAELETIADKQGHLEKDWETIGPLIGAWRGGRIWTASWWRAALHSGLNEQAHDLETRRAELQSARQRLEQDMAARRAEHAEIAERYSAQRRRAIDEEIGHRQRELDGDIASVRRERDAVHQQWQKTDPILSPQTIPTEISRDAAAAALAEWQRQCERAEQRTRAAEQWLRALEESQRSLPDKLMECANLVAAPLPALTHDPHFGEKNGKPLLRFDLLIVDEAHLLPEAEFAAVARRARRWVLVGEPSVANPQRPQGTPGLFARLWKSLHADPRRLPFTWLRRDGRLTCRLRPISAEQAKWIETEPVADRPEIELRIVSAPHQSPRIAEVAFPAEMDLSEAKQFIFRELEELAICTRGRAARWRETEDAVILAFSAYDDPSAITVTLEEGVSERMVCTSAQEPSADNVPTCDTLCLQFDRAAGWDRERAEQWVVQRLGLRFAGRTALLTVPYRLDPTLARFVSDLLFDGVCEPAPSAGPAALSRAPVEFIAVPAYSKREDSERSNAEATWNGGDGGRVSGERTASAVARRSPPARSLKGGAGLETDLSDHRPLGQLPADVRAVLPRKGLVNYAEGRAVVRRLEALLDDPEFQSACLRWRQRCLLRCEHACASPSAECDCPRAEGGPAVAVMALYPAQVELLRRLIEQRPALARSAAAIEVALPSALAHRECLLALVSLTRSHTHRAVSYGDHPQLLAQAMTRAASGLILFGDPGTLARRSQWRGPLDHLDEADAQREAGWAGRLMQYLQGCGSHPTAIHFPEGSGV